MKYETKAILEPIWIFAGMLGVIFALALVGYGMFRALLWVIF